jgi:ADP-heptose:LPS heptosyltransferase
MREVIRQLVKDYPDARIMLFGRGKDEDATFPQWIEEMPQCTIVSQHISAMQQELILMSHLDVMVSMDSANMHLASLVNTPVVSVWGATHPMAGFLGWHQKKENAIQLDMECRPCSIYGQKPCIHGDFRCMTGIKPEMIVERIKNIINP